MTCLCEARPMTVKADLIKQLNQHANHMHSKGSSSDAIPDGWPDERCTWICAPQGHITHMTNVFSALLAPGVQRAHTVILQTSRTCAVTLCRMAKLPAVTMDPP